MMKLFRPGWARSLAVGCSLLGLGLLVGCDASSQPKPDETAKNAPPVSPKPIQDIAKKSGRPIPKSIKDRS
jgi:hypothetical protein